MRTLPPIVNARLALASAVPVIAVACSAALTVSSPATKAIVGVSGATVSTVMLRVAIADGLPAASVAVTARVSPPSPIAAISAGVSV